jgi:hypothetical protein
MKILRVMFYFVGFKSFSEIHITDVPLINFPLCTKHHWQNSPFWATGFLPSGFSLLWISQQYSFCTQQGRQPCVQPPMLRTSPGDRVAQLYPQALRFLSVAFYDSQGYDGGILSRLHTGAVFFIRSVAWYSLGADNIENTASNGTSIAACVRLLSNGSVRHDQIE